MNGAGRVNAVNQIPLDTIISREVHTESYGHHQLLVSGHCGEAAVPATSPRKEV